jgi:glycosyltransferase involved in cell wall biosynthesis
MSVKNNMKKSLLVRGPLLTQSGYGYHSRQFVFCAMQLLEAGKFNSVATQCMRWGDTPWLINPENDFDKAIIEFSMNRSIEPNPSEKFDCTVQIQLPNEWNPNLGKFNIGVTAGVETDRLSKEWIKACFAMDRIIVPSEFTKQTFINSVSDDYDKRRLNKRIHVIAEAFHPALIDTEMNLQSSKITNLVENLPANNFLFFGQLTGNDAATDRKNVFSTIRWFIEEFGSDDNVGLVIKTNSGKNTTIDRKLTSNIISSCVDEVKNMLGIAKETDTGVRLLHGSISEFEKTELYTHDKITALLMPTRGEGYGLPVIESAVLGLPIIATDYSGYKDFVSSREMYPISYSMIPVPQNKIDGNIFVEGCKWAEPNGFDCKLKMRQALNSDKIKDSVVALSHRVLETHSIKAISTQIAKVIMES